MRFFFLFGNALFAKTDNKFLYRCEEQCIKYVSAKSQSMFLTKLIDENFFSKEELDVVDELYKKMYAEYTKEG